MMICYRDVGPTEMDVLFANTDIYIYNTYIYMYISRSKYTNISLKKKYIHMEPSRNPKKPVFKKR